MKLNDLVIAVVLIAGAVAIFAYARSFPPIPGQPYGAGAFPTLIALGLGGFSTALGWRAWRERRAAGGGRLVEPALWAMNRKAVANFFIALALILAYVFLSETLGFIPIAVAILLVLFLRQEVKLPTALVTAVTTAIVIHIAFADFLRVPLPRGLLDRVLW